MRVRCRCVRVAPACLTTRRVSTGMCARATLVSQSRWLCLDDHLERSKAKREALKARVLADCLLDCAIARPSGGSTGVLANLTPFEPRPSGF